MLTIIIEEDTDHMHHVAADLRMARRKGWAEEEELRREELENLEDATWTAYGVTVARVCECCDQITEQYVAALWGCVVSEWNAAGRYDDLTMIQDDYLREVAADVMAEAVKLADV